MFTNLWQLRRFIFWRCLRLLRGLRFFQYAINPRLSSSIFAVNHLKLRLFLCVNLGSSLICELLLKHMLIKTFFVIIFITTLKSTTIESLFTCYMLTTISTYHSVSLGFIRIGLYPFHCMLSCAKFWEWFIKILSDLFLFLMSLQLQLFDGVECSLSFARYDWFVNH